MSSLVRNPDLATAYAAMDRADWPAAAYCFREAAGDGLPEALEGLGLASFIMRSEATFEAYEKVFDAYQRAGDSLGACRAAMMLGGYWFIMRGQFALANGWLQRARSLLDGLSESREHGWVCLYEAQKALYGLNDPHAAADSSAEALAIAKRTGDSSLAALALAAEGLVLVYRGLDAEGLSRLDEAATACVSGEVRDPWVINSVLCNMMEACGKTRDWDRANEWFQHIANLATRWGDVEFYAQCRPHYAAVLTWRGAWQQAEDQLRSSIDTLFVKVKPMAVEGIVRLAELRWRQGRFDEAAALFEDVKHEPMSQPGQSLLALDLEQPELGLKIAERHLRRLPRSARIERMQALEVYMRACIANGALEQVAGASAEVEEIGRLVTTPSVRAAASLTLGLIAAAGAQPDAARGQLEDAVDLYEAAGAPFEASVARLDLAAVLIDLGRGQDAARLAGQACSALERLGATRQAARARLLIHRISDQPAVEAASPVAGLSPREVEVLGLLAGGLSNQEIADRLVLSIRTVQRHVENIYAKTGARGRAAAAVFAANHQIV